MELRELSGRLTDLTATVDMPPRGHFSSFLHEIEGFRNMPATFEGTLHLTASAPGITAIGIRGRYNELGTFIATTTGPIKQMTGPEAVVVFPHLVNGSGFVTKLILLSSGTGASGSLRFFDAEGRPLYIGVVPGSGF
jgi:hypothetical protein